MKDVRITKPMATPAKDEDKQDALCVLDKSCHFVYVNQTMADLHGISCESHKGRSISEIVPSIAHIAEFAVHEVLRTQTPLTLSLVGHLLPTADNTRHWVVCYLPVADGTEVAMVATEIKPGLVPLPEQLVVVCAWCRRIRNPEGTWVEIASFPAREHVTLTHGICRECTEKQISRLARTG